MAIGDALNALRDELWKEIESAYTRVDTTEGEAHERAKFERDLLIRVQNRLVEVTEATVDEIRQATEASKQRTTEMRSRTKLIEEATARIQQLEAEKQEQAKIIEQAAATITEMTESFQELDANVKTLFELEAAASANPQDGAAKQRLDTFIQKVLYDHLRRN